MNIGSIFIKVGALFVIASLLIFFLIFYPVILEEAKFALRKNNDVDNIVVLDSLDAEIKDNVIIPADKEFSIIVPKIDANAKVVENVDPYTSAIYQRELTQGVAHAAGSQTPNLGGNTFLFAHSSDNFYNANRYNSVFYLMHKLEAGDKFYLVYDNELYQYKVTEKAIVDASRVDYLANTADSRATLMTCWPPGTTLQRLLVVGELVADGAERETKEESSEIEIEI